MNLDEARAALDSCNADQARKVIGFLLDHITFQQGQIDALGKRVDQLFGRTDVLIDRIGFAGNVEKERPRSTLNWPGDETANGEKKP